MKRLVLVLMIVFLLFVNVNVFAYSEIDIVADQIQGNIQQRISTNYEENNEYLNESISELSELKVSVSYANLSDLQRDKHYPVEMLITGIISVIFILTMSLCIVLNNKKRKALN